MYNSGSNWFYVSYLMRWLINLDENTLSLWKEAERSGVSSSLEKIFSLTRETPKFQLTLSSKPLTYKANEKLSEVQQAHELITHLSQADVGQMHIILDKFAKGNLRACCYFVFKQNGSIVNADSIEQIESERIIAQMGG